MLTYVRMDEPSELRYVPCKAQQCRKGPLSLPERLPERPPRVDKLLELSLNRQVQLGRESGAPLGVAIIN